MAEIQLYPDLLDYANAKIREARGARSFMSAFCEACLRADGANFEVLRPTLTTLMQKYPAKAPLLDIERRERLSGQ
jgi:hypothetical protein